MLRVGWQVVHLNRDLQRFNALSQNSGAGSSMGAKVGVLNNRIATLDMHILGLASSPRLTTSTLARATSLKTSRVMDTIRWWTGYWRKNRSPAPTPTPTSTTPSIPVTTKTSGALTLTNAHDLVFDGVDFEGSGNGWGDASGLVVIQGASYNITFRNCIFGTNKDGVGNGVKVIDSGAGIHDITFDHVYVKYQPRMGLEVIGRAKAQGGGTNGYQRVNVTNSIFEASAGEAISYDDDSGTAGNCTVSGNLVKGAGVGSSYQYGQVFEINGTHNMTVTGNTIYAGRDGILNFQMHDTRATGWVFSDNVVDATHIEPGITVNTSIAQPLCAYNVYGGAFARNTITNKNSWNIAYLAGSHNMDWRTTKWLGPNNTPYQTGCSGGLF
jgi:hypothetical protein